MNSLLDLCSLFVFLWFFWHFLCCAQMSLAQHDLEVLLADGLAQCTARGIRTQAKQAEFMSAYLTSGVTKLSMRVISGLVKLF